MLVVDDLFAAALRGMIVSTTVHLELEIPGLWIPGMLTSPTRKVIRTTGAHYPTVDVA